MEIEERESMRDKPKIKTVYQAIIGICLSIVIFGITLFGFFVAGINSEAKRYEKLTGLTYEVPEITDELQNVGISVNDGLQD